VVLWWTTLHLLSGLTFSSGTLELPGPAEVQAAVAVARARQVRGTAFVTYCSTSTRMAPLREVAVTVSLRVSPA